MRAGGDRPAPTEPAGETSPSAPCQKTGENTGFSPVSFFHVLHGYVVHIGSDTVFSHLFYPFSIVPIPSSTQNAPDFGCFRINSGASLFLLVFGRKIFDIFFVHSADMVHKSKSLVIPLSRDVSFLT